MAKLTGQQRYRQAMTLADRRHKRMVSDFIAGRITHTEMCGMDRERACLIREFDRAYNAGLAAGRALRATETKT